MVGIISEDFLSGGVSELTSLRSSFPALPRAVLHRSVVKSVTPRTKRQRTRPLPSPWILVCGKRGIRTPGTSRFNGFQDRRNRPLCHLSGDKSSTLFPFYQIPAGISPRALPACGGRRTAFPERSFAAVVPTGCLPVVRVPAVRRPCGRGLPLPAGKKVETDVREIFINFVRYG